MPKGRRSQPPWSCLPGPWSPAQLAGYFKRRLAAYQAMSRREWHDIARMCGEAPGRFSQVRLGLRLPSWEQVCALANRTGLEPWWWFRETPENNGDDPLTAISIHLDLAKDAVQRLHGDREPRGNGSR